MSRMRAPLHLFTPGGSRKTAVVGLLSVIVAAECAGLVSGIWQYSLLVRLSYNEEIGDSTLLASDLIYSGIGLLQTGLYFACAVAFCMWFHRVYKNLSPLGSKYLEYTPAKAVAGFFIPFLNLVRPYWAAKEIWKKSYPILEPGPLDPGGDSSIVGRWWGFFIASGIAANLASRIHLQAETIPALEMSTDAFMVADILSAVAALSAISMIRQVDLMQSKRHRVLQTGAQP